VCGHIDQAIFGSYKIELEKTSEEPQKQQHDKNFQITLNKGFFTQNREQHDLNFQITQNKDFFLSRN
jgi:translation initiation factor IF-3